MSTFARLAAACHPSVPPSVAAPALAEALVFLRGMAPVDAKAARALVRAVLDAGSEDLALAALAVLPGATLGERTLPTSAITESPTDGVGAAWEGTIPSTTAARLWLWANDLDGGNGFELLCRTHAGGTKGAVTSPMRLALALATLDGLDWSVPEGKPTALLQLLRWRLEGLEAPLVAALGPIDARLATLPAALWIQAWTGDSSVLSLPVVAHFAVGLDLAQALLSVHMSHARKNGIAVPRPTSIHGALALLHALPDRVPYEALAPHARIDALRACLGTTTGDRKPRRTSDKDSAEANRKRAARAAKAAAAAHPVP